MACASASPQPSEAEQRSFHLVGTALTRLLASTTPEWGASYPSHAGFQQSHHSILQHAIIRSLALHSACTNRSEAAVICIVAAPKRGGCLDWSQLCPGKKLAVVDAADAEVTPRFELCTHATLCVHPAASRFCCSF